MFVSFLHVLAIWYRFLAVQERFVETVCNVGLSHVLAILVLRRYTPIDNPPFDIELDNHLPKYSYR